jgi:hypothetical protein
MIARLGSAAVTLSDGSLMVLGGCVYGGVAGTCTASNDVWESADGGRTWLLVTWNAGWIGKEQSAVERVSHFISAKLLFSSPLSNITIL